MTSNSAYSALPDSTIRLLVLKPAEPGMPLRCSFRHHKISTTEEEIDAYHYTALSYVWGLPKFPCTISCKAAPSGERTRPTRNPARRSVEKKRARTVLPITQNLFDALVSLRSRRDRKTLWIDAICIDQQSSSEKATQIPLMKFIYRDAEEVIIWLGKRMPQTSSALALVRRAAFQKREECGASLPSFHDIQDENTDKLQLNRVRVPAKKPIISWEPLLHFLKNRWFSRIWTLQEVLLARNATMRVGHSQLLLVDFVDAVAFFHKEQIHLGIDVAPLLLDGRWKLLRDSSASRLQNTQIPYDCWVLMNIIPSLDATEPRDKIYGLLSLMDPYIRARINVDYTKPVALVYAEAIKIFVRTGPKEANLLFLTHIDHSEGIDLDFPTWIPRYDKPVPKSSRSLKKPGLSFTDYNAGGEFILPCQMDAYASNILPVHGLIFTSIKSVVIVDAPFFRPHEMDTGTFSADLLSLYCAVRDIHDNFTSLSGNKNLGSFEDALAVALTSGERLSTAGNRQSNGRDLKRFMFWAKDFLQQSVGKRIREKTILPKSWQKPMPRFGELRKVSKFCET